MLFGHVTSKVIPRLLRPLETGGRQIKPSLVHGDLYSGNVSVDAVTGGPGRPKYPVLLVSYKLLLLRAQ